MSQRIPERGPFSLDQAPAYHRWRAEKLHAQPADVGDLLVPIADPLRLSPAERAAGSPTVSRHKAFTRS